MSEETARIKKVYARRDSSGRTGMYSPFNLPHLYVTQTKERALLALLRECAMSDLATKKILDVGCGNGNVLRDMVNYGAEPGNCYGIDLLADRIESANRLSPNMHFTCENAERLPYGDGEFDLLLSYTVFSSIFDPDMKRNMAKEMLRVLAANGAVVFYDYHMNNPKNPDVRGIKKSELGGLFPGCSMVLKRIVLAPPLIRALAPLSFTLCMALESLAVLNTHYMGIIRKY